MYAIADRVSSPVGSSAAVAASTVRLSRCAESQSCNFSVTARATLCPLCSAEAVRLFAAEVVNSTASTIITGNETSNIAATKRGVKRRCRVRHRVEAGSLTSVPVSRGGCGGFEVAGEVGEVAGGVGDLLGGC
ncbi:hypothetical protein [Promicromonospora sp. AC04]|uniref:hypothetical protein n=1 Tax=Promicromonospora sp. AC04 TaxID=2135723 RepID=UPI0026B9C318